MSILSAPHFHSQAAAIARLEEIVWPQGPHCPRCGGFDRITVVKGGRPGLRRCGPCGREFTVTVGTVFERSHVKLHIWFQAAHLMASSKKGISAHQLHRTLGVTYKTAWFMEHRLREAMADGSMIPLGGEGKTLEADTSYVGGKEKNKHKSKRAEKPQIGGMGKQIVHTLVERGGAARSHQETPPELAWHEGASFGSIVGELKKLDDFEHDKEFVIVPPVGAPVVCTFPDTMLSEMGQYWSKIVRVSGVLHYKSNSPFPASVEVRKGGVELYRQQPPKRTLAQLRGVFEGRERPNPDWDSLIHG